MNHPSKTATDNRDAALSDLRRAVAALKPHLDAQDQRADLLLIEEAVARLSRPRRAFSAGLREFDASRLSHLLDLTGPDMAQELLARLTEDLITSEDMLDQGAGALDWKRLREGSHVLISLSGSVGALSLQAMAEELNAVAHHQDADALSAVMPTLTGELRALIALIRTTSLPDGTAP